MCRLYFFASSRHGSCIKAEVLSPLVVLIERLGVIIINLRKQILSSNRKLQPQWGLVTVIATSLLLLPALFYAGIIDPIDVVGWPGEATVFLSLNSIVILSLVALETTAMNVTGTSSGRGDRGYISGIMTVVAVLYAPVFDRYVMDVLTIETNQFTYYMLGIGVCILGATVRKVAKNTLGIYFSHELRVLDDQMVIDHGIYRYVRHPAYLGTLLLVPGISWMFLSHIGVLLLVPTLFVALGRIQREELMLVKNLGTEYRSYINRSKMIIPFIY